MVLTTYQRPDVYAGILSGNYRPMLSKSYVSTCSERERRAYAWLKAQMRLRVGDEPLGVTTPYWAWLFRKNAPLENYDKAFAGDMKLTLDIDESRVLVSSYEDWHCVLNGFPVLSLEEWVDDEDEREETMKKYCRCPQKTWPRIFDMKNYPEPLTWAFQVTFWELFPDDIVDVVHV